MDISALVWSLGTLPAELTMLPLLAAIGFALFFFWDYPVLLVVSLVQRVLGIDRTWRDRDAQMLPTLVVIPSLLRNESELLSMMSTVESIASNGYPGELTVVLSIDGTTDSPPLYKRLQDWAAQRPRHIKQRLYVTGTVERRSKPMAIDHGMLFVKQLVSDGVLDRFPPVYISTDADADLGPRAIEHIVRRLQRKNRITGWPARVVAGALHVRGDDFWRGFRHCLTPQGQLNLQIAREYYVSNIWRHNIRWLPVTGVPGAFYCTWSEIFLALPQYMGYQRTLTSRHYVEWWLGKQPPKYSGTTAPPNPELVAGDTDDTVTAYTATLARYENGHFTFDPPRTPLHAFYYAVRGLLIDRALQYEPEARVYTSSPNKVKTLFKQRRRWNSSRLELTGRFWPSLGYHWTLGLPALVIKFFMARTVLFGALAYFVVPLLFWRTSMLTGVVLGYVSNVCVWGLLTLFTIAINGEPKFWRLLIGIPFAPLYQFVFNWLPCFVGLTSDFFLFGNVTGFAPETTLIRGGSQRIALLSRGRRFLSLCVRSVVWADVPLGRFWFGWRETPWTASGFEGFTTGKRRRTLPPLRSWFRHRPRGDVS